MTTVIRDKKTGEYFAGGKWSKNFDDAEKFYNLLDLVQAREEFQLGAAQIVLLCRRAAVRP